MPHEYTGIREQERENVSFIVPLWKSFRSFPPVFTGVDRSPPRGTRHVQVLSDAQPKSGDLYFTADTHRIP